MIPYHEFKRLVRSFGLRSYRKPLTYFIVNGKKTYRYFPYTNTYEFEGKILSGRVIDLCKKIKGYVENPLPPLPRRWSFRLRKELYIKCPYCWVCKKKLQFGECTIDHIVPRCRGGTHDLSNLILACVLCNSSRENKP